MLPYFPKSLSSKAMYTYFVALAAIFVLFPYKMTWYMYLFGAVGVYCFFNYSSLLSAKWLRYPQYVQEKKMFRTSLWIRVIYVFFSYCFFSVVTGEPFDLNAFDSIGYYETAWTLANDYVSINELIATSSLDDVGYPIYLYGLYMLTGGSIIIPRLIKALLNSWTVLLMFKYCCRNFDKSTALLAGCFCMLMPNLIWYCGVHNKETEMLFLTVLFIERADYIFRQTKIKLKDILLVLLPCVGVFFFRKVLAYCMVLSLMVTGVLTTDKIAKRKKKIFMLFFIVCLIFVGVYEGFTAVVNTEDFSDLADKQAANMAWRAERGGGNYLAKYAGAAVFAPMIFTLPFPTMAPIDGQENQQMLHCGYFVRNLLSGFTILALFILLMSREWRKHVLSLSFMIGYLVILVFSQFAQSERFHIPVLPFILMYAAFGVTHLSKKHLKLYDLWCVLIFCICLGWQWFKLKGRGMI